MAYMRSPTHQEKEDLMVDIGPLKEPTIEDIDKYFEELDSSKNDQPFTPTPAGTFYCQAGDHLVDSVVWLEQITLGCQPCMVKMREKIGSGLNMRLWKVDPQGYRRVIEDKPASPPRSLVAQARKTPKKAAPWRCNECRNFFDDLGEGYYNTGGGYTCKSCAGTQKLGRTAETALQRERRVERNQIKKIHRKGMNQTLRLSSVEQNHTIRLEGMNASIVVSGDVRGTVRTEGMNGTIHIMGKIRTGAWVEANGMNSTIKHGGAEPDSTVAAIGMNASVQDLSTRSRKNSRSLQEAISNYNGFALDTRSKIEDIRAKLAYDVGNLIPDPPQVCCDTCGKKVTPVAAWDPNTDLPRCSACWEKMGATPLGGGRLMTADGRLPYYRIKDLARINGLQMVDRRDQFPLYGVEGLYFYVINDDDLFKWVESAKGWTKVPLPAPSTPRLVYKQGEPEPVESFF